MIELSICIPTYNFGAFIAETLDSILPQCSPSVEVIVLDSGSTDKTADVVRARQKDYPRLIYVYQHCRGGIDRDIEKVVDLAQGRYCWLISADDVMLSCAIDIVLGAIKSKDDVYLCEHDICSLAMKPVCDYPIFTKTTKPRVFDLGDSVQRQEYFRTARTSEAFFSFLSTPIFNKSHWDTVTVPNSFYGSCWIVAGHLLSQVPKGFKVNYLGKKLLHKRAGNDSFSVGGVVNRCRIAIEAFQLISHHIFGEHSVEAFHIRRALQQDIPLRFLLSAKHLAAIDPARENIKVLDRIVEMHYADRNIGNWLKRSLYHAAHPIALKLAYRIKNMNKNCA